MKHDCRFMRANRLMNLGSLTVLCSKTYHQNCSSYKYELNLRLNSINEIMTTKEGVRKLNRIKAVLAETGHTGKWLAEQLGKDPATVSKWCTNTSQPDLYTLNEISEVLSVKVIELIKP